MQAAANQCVTIEPEFVRDRDGADVLAVSPRTFAELVRRGEIKPVRVPGFRRVVYSVAELRAVAGRWRARRDQGDTGDDNAEPVGA
jgi:hypothetical protein